MNVWAGKNKEIERYLKKLQKRSQAQEFSVLLVSDNGIGFNDSTMEAILAEGTPEKSNGSSGSFGIGHLSAFGLSGLNYVIYAGKNDNESVATGHAIIASHQSNDKDNKSRSRSNHGYYIEKYTDDFFNRFIFAKDDTINPFITKWLDKINTTGSVVAIIDYNHFNLDEEEKNLTQIIEEAIAKNFAIAIESGMLSVKINGSTTINKNNLSSIVDEAINANIDDDILTHTKDNLLTFTSPSSQEFIESPFSDCQLFIRNQSNSHGVSIWRNGMLITRTHRGFARSHFDTQLFDALVILDGKNKYKHSHDLIRKAETPLHDKFEIKRLDTKSEKDDLTELLSRIRKWLISKAEQLKDKPIELDEIWLNGEQENVKIEPVVIKTSEIEIKTDDEDNDKDEEYGKDESNDNKSAYKETTPLFLCQGEKISHDIIFDKDRNQSISQEWIFKFIPKKTLKDVRVYFFIDSGQDPSCTSKISQDVITITSAQLHSNNSKSTSIKYKKNRITLGDTQTKKEYIVTIKCKINTNNLKVLSLSARIYKPKESKIIAC